MKFLQKNHVFIKIQSLRALTIHLTCGILIIGIVNPNTYVGGCVTKIPFNSFLLVKKRIYFPRGLLGTNWITPKLLFITNFVLQ